MQRRLQDLTCDGYRVFAISYDTVETLAKFGAEHSIKYVMLSDVGSHVIRRLGLINDIAPEQARMYGVTFRPEYEGVPHPGTFVLDERGVVVDRWFEESYRVRPSGALLMEWLSNRIDPSAAAVTALASGTGVGVQAWLTDSVYKPWVEMVLHITIVIEPGLHLYAPPTPGGFRALEVSVTPRAALFSAPPALPPGSPFDMPGFDHEFFVYEGSVQVDLSFTLIENVGPAEIEVVVSYQACSDSTCFTPETVTLQLALIGSDHDTPVPPLPES